jgi:hypothetical protein
MAAQAGNKRSGPGGDRLSALMHFGSHANEIATTGGVVNPGTRTSRFIELIGQIGRPDDSSEDIAVFVPRSGITLEFDGQARCRAGCK